MCELLPVVFFFVSFDGLVFLFWLTGLITVLCRLAQKHTRRGAGIYSWKVGMQATRLFVGTGAQAARLLLFQISSPIELTFANQISPISNL